MYMGSTRNKIEFGLNSQTVLILLLLLRTVCGVELLSFNKNCGALKSQIVGRQACSRAKHKTLGRLTDVAFRF